mmetsp:Transcript_85255/g.206682  ORF Transcript_85255/g.206682 Transcript_85255/m.206682 type:complete len:201 (+) Transcript_85255:1012-1614(+)
MWLVTSWASTAPATASQSCPLRPRVDRSPPRTPTRPTTPTTPTPTPTPRGAAAAPPTAPRTSWCAPWTAAARSGVRARTRSSWTTPAGRRGRPCGAWPSRTRTGTLAWSGGPSGSRCRLPSPETSPPTACTSRASAASAWSRCGEAGGRRGWWRLRQRASTWRSPYRAAPSYPARHKGWVQLRATLMARAHLLEELPFVM